MKRVAGLALAVTLSSAAAYAQAAAPSEATDAALPSVSLPPELDRVLRGYETAWRARDPQALSELFAEDGFVLASGRPPVRGRDAIREAYAGSGGPLHLRGLAFDTNGDVGYIIGAYSGAADTPDDGKFVLILKLGEGGRWLIMADMDNGSQRRPPVQAPASSPAPSASPSPTPSPSPPGG
jgi:ketosteroid isomerase-like protein